MLYHNLTLFEHLLFLLRGGEIHLLVGGAPQVRALLLGLHVPAERERLLRILSGRTRGVVMQVQLVKTVAFRKVSSFLVRHQSFLASINLVLWKAYFRILLAEPSVILRLNFG